MNWTERAYVIQAGIEASKPHWPMLLALVLALGFFVDGLIWALALKGIL